MEIKVIEVINPEPDVLLIGGMLVSESGEERPVCARGWVSATTNHFDADAYDAETGHRKDEATARAMTDEEKQAYYRRLLREQNGITG